MNLRTVLVAGVIVAIGFATREGRASERFKNIAKILGEPIQIKQEYLQTMSLKECLGLLHDDLKAKGKELLILVDWAAFSNENPDLYETPESLYNLQIKLFIQAEMKNMKISAAELLRWWLSQIPTRNATFAVRRDHVEITTRDAITTERILRKPVTASFDKAPLEEALAEIAENAGVTIVVDIRAGDKAQKPVSATFRTTISVQAAVKMLAEMADLDSVVVENALFVTTPQHAERLRKQIPAKKDPGPVQKVQNAKGVATK